MVFFSWAEMIDHDNWWWLYKRTMKKACWNYKKKNQDCLGSNILFINQCLMGLFKEWNKENTNLPWVCCRKFSKLFGEINLGIRHWLCQWVIFFFASKGQLGINCLVACNNYNDFKFFYTKFLHGDGQARSCQNFLYSLKCTRILATFNLMPKSSNCCKLRPIYV